MTDNTRRIITTCGAAAIISLVLVAPFAFLEIRNNTAARSSLFHFPFALFGVLWLLPTAFILLVAPVVSRLRSGENILAHPVTLLLRITILAIVATMWVSLLKDQMPCFLGVPNCD